MKTKTWMQSAMFQFEQRGLSHASSCDIYLSYFRLVNLMRICAKDLRIFGTVRFFFGYVFWSMEQD